MILALLSILFGVSYLVSKLLGLPSSLALPVWANIIGLAISAVALLFVIWLFRYRSPSNMIVSTHYTFSKMLGRKPLSVASGRTEPLIIKGPQKYVRHPLYFGVTALTFGWGLFTDTTYLLIATIAVLLWYVLVQIPFEEKELIALFGDQYRKYMEETPMLFPFTKSKKNKL